MTFVMTCLQNGIIPYVVNERSFGMGTCPKEARRLANVCNVSKRRSMANCRDRSYCNLVLRL